MLNDELIRHRRELHMMPEIGFDLPKTRSYILNELGKTQARVSDGANGAVLAYFNVGKQRTLAFRTDMDALPLTESTGAVYASKHPGKMHACGHDAHMAIMLAFADWLSNNLDILPDNVLLVFQPAEEIGLGARELSKDSLIASADEIYALHVDPMLPAGVIASKPGALMARSSELYLDVYGKASHIASASEGRDAMEAAAELLIKLYAMESTLPEGEPRLLKFGIFNAGEAQNIIAGHARLGGSLRAFDDDLFARMNSSIREIADQISREKDVRVNIDLGESCPPVINDDGLYKKAVERLAPMGFVELEKPYMIAEDFSYYQKSMPGLMLRLGLGTDIPLHSTNFDFDEHLLARGVEAFRRILIG